MLKRLLPCSLLVCPFGTARMVLCHSRRPERYCLSILYDSRYRSSGAVAVVRCPEPMLRPIAYCVLRNEELENDSAQATAAILHTKTTAVRLRHPPLSTVSPPLYS